MGKHVTINGTCSDCGSKDISSDNLNWWCNNCDNENKIYNTDE